jgi:signal transduction histidine kinase
MAKDLTHSELILTPANSFNVTNGFQHYVQFYQEDKYLLESLKDYIVPGIKSKDVCIVIASSSHRNEIAQVLINQKVNIEKARREGIYIDLDASEVLSQIMLNGKPDKDLFEKIVGSLIINASKNGLRVRAFGEMVSILWKIGNKNGALELEKYWNDLRKKEQFVLLCAYPMGEFNNESDSSIFSEIIADHSSIIPTESYMELVNQDEQLRAIAILQQKAEALESEIAERKKLEVMKDEFIAAASHELKTPLTSLKTYSHILQNRLSKLDGDKSYEYILKMDKQLNRMTHLVSDLLDVTRIQSGSLQFTKQYFDLNQLIEEITDEISETSDRSIVLRLGKHQDIYGDRDKIAQVILNFLANADKYSEKNKKIVIRTIVHKEEIIVSVEDHGIGISEENREKVFQRFFRESGNMESTFPGIGLGLYISSEIIKRHYGRIWVSSKKGKGSKFYFSLPVPHQTKF